MATAPTHQPSRRSFAALVLTGIVALGAAACSATADSTSPAAHTGTATTTSTNTTSVRHLDPKSFAALATQPGTVLLDVRTPVEYAAGHLPNARNLDLQSSDFTQRLSSLDKRASYALYCHSGNRSTSAAQQMLANGFTTVADLAGGISAWTAVGNTVVTS